MTLYRRHVFSGELEFFEFKSTICLFLINQFRNLFSFRLCRSHFCRMFDSSLGKINHPWKFDLVSVSSQVAISVDIFPGGGMPMYYSRGRGNAYNSRGVACHSGMNYEHLTPHTIMREDVM